MNIQLDGRYVVLEGLYRWRGDMVLNVKTMTDTEAYVIPQADKESAGRSTALYARVESLGHMRARQLVHRIDADGPKMQEMLTSTKFWTRQVIVQEVVEDDDPVAAPKKVARLWQSDSMYDLNKTVPHGKVPTAVCDECGKRCKQAGVGVWSESNAKGELMLCRGKKGCLRRAKTGWHMTAYDRLATTKTCK